MKATELFNQVDSMYSTLEKLRPEIVSTIGKEALDRWQTDVVDLVDGLCSIRYHLLALTDGRPRTIYLGEGRFIECGPRGPYEGKVDACFDGCTFSLSMNELRHLREWLTQPEKIVSILTWIDAAVEFHEERGKT